MKASMPRFQSARVLWALRFALGVLFLYASFGKILDPKAFAETLIGYRIFDSAHMIKYLAVTLPWIEWFCGVFLVLGVFVRSVAALTSCLLVTFIIAMVSALARGLEVPCGCFGSAGETIGPFSLLRDVCFLFRSLAVLLSSPDHYTLQVFFRNLKTLKTSSAAEV
jgi:putative oxidoreductase